MRTSQRTDFSNKYQTYLRNKQADAGVSFNYDTVRKSLTYDLPKMEAQRKMQTTNQLMFSQNKSMASQDLVIHSKDKERHF